MSSLWLLTLLKLVGKITSLESLELSDRSVKLLEVFFLQVDVVESLVDSGVVVELNALKEVLDQG